MASAKGAAEAAKLEELAEARKAAAKLPIRGFALPPEIVDTAVGETACGWLKAGGETPDFSPSDAERMAALAAAAGSAAAGSRAEPEDAEADGDLIWTASLFPPA